MHLRILLVSTMLAWSLSISAQTPQFVFVNEDPGFRVRSGWAYDNTVSQKLNNYVFSVTGPGTGTRVCAWTMDGLPPGTYLAEYHIGYGSYASNAEYVIESDVGSQSVTRSQYQLAKGWYSLGTYQFTNAGRILQTDNGLAAGTKAVADAIRVTYQGTPPTVSTLNCVQPAVGICIDDLGSGSGDPNNPGSGTYQLLQNAPGYTYAVMPFQTYTSAFLTKASGLGVEMILHQPMAAIADGNTIYDSHTLHPTQLTDSQNLARFTSDLSNTSPYTIGVNNHRGSQFSQSAHGMQIVTDELYARGQFYFDSRTISDSVGMDTAHATGLPSAERDWFVDGDNWQTSAQCFNRLVQRAKYYPNACIAESGITMMETP